MQTDKQTSLTSILQWRAANQPDRLAYRFLEDGEFGESVVTYKVLDSEAKSIAALLQSCTKEGDRALLLFPPGLSFIAAYFGCLYAKIIAVPVYPPHPACPGKVMPAVRSIISDAGPAVVLLPQALFASISAHPEAQVGLENTRLMVIEPGELNGWAGHWNGPVVEETDIAFLQYTSGSTSTPRGVVVRHRNLLYNLAHIEKSFGQSENSSAVIWLPPYHDMGLIGGILQPLYSGYPATLMPHLLFLQRPFRWLQAVSRFGATTSGGPNFAFDLCVRKIGAELLDQLDLSRWEVAFNGAEPVHAKTLNRFAGHFAPCGFRRDAILPCYGLAESTLLVTGGPRFRPPVEQHLMKWGLEENKVAFSDKEVTGTKTLVGCGANLSEAQEIKIVDPDSGVLCASDEIGEIWLRSPGVASGYWNKPAETEETFGAELTGGDGKKYLRTGDLGFLKDGELYITGRLKNVVISGGKNHYAHDIERTVEGSHSAIWPGGCAVFATTTDGPERIVVVVEVRSLTGEEEQEVTAAICEAVAQHHGLSVQEIRLTKPGGIPRTTSGKIRHFLCKKNITEGTAKQIVGV